MDCTLDIYLGERERGRVRGRHSLAGERENEGEKVREKKKKLKNGTHEMRL